MTCPEISAEGYHPAEKTFTVNDGVITNLSIQLIPVSNTNRRRKQHVRLNVINAGPVHNQSNSPSLQLILNNTQLTNNNNKLLSDSPPSTPVYSQSVPFTLSVRDSKSLSSGSHAKHESWLNCKNPPNLAWLWLSFWICRLFA